MVASTVRIFLKVLCCCAGSLGALGSSLTLQQGATCQPSWVPTFGSYPLGVDDSVFALTVFDNGVGGGPTLYAGGKFTTASGVVLNHVARLDDTSWSPLGSGMNAPVRVLVVHDDGSGGGPALYAGGEFTTAGGVPANYIAKWDGTSWSALGTGMTGRVWELTVYDDGSGGGPALYAGGEFTTAGGVAVNHIAKWDGTSWSQIASGMNAPVHALMVHDDGSGGGPALYAGGEFTAAGGVVVNHIARWDGTVWSPLGSGMVGGCPTSSVLALAVFDDGNGGGSALYAGGEFTTAGGVSANHIARWNGSSWSPLGYGVGCGSTCTVEVLSLTVFNDGTSGPALYAGGRFCNADGSFNYTSTMAKWDGTSWSSLGSPIRYSGPVFALTVYDDGGGPALYAGGSFGVELIGADALFVAKWDGTDWFRLGFGPMVGPPTSNVLAMAVLHDGSGQSPALYVGGEFWDAGKIPARYVASWDGAGWSRLGYGVWPPPIAVQALAAFDDGSGNGPALYAGGAFDRAGNMPAARIAKWDQASWSPLGSGMDSAVRALIVHDDGQGGGPALYAGGDFGTAGGTSANHIAKWNGTSWSTLGSGMNAPVHAFAVHDDGSGGGPALYAGGMFTTAGGAQAKRVAKWDGTSWSPLRSGVNGSVVSALTVYDDGSGAGPALYAGGDFSIAGGVLANRLAKWDGTSWSPLGSGIYGSIVSALTVYDDGRGPELYAGGDFTTAGGVSANRIAKWDGTSWSALGSGMTGSVAALAVFDDGRGGGPALFAGGSFERAIDSGDSFLAKWVGCLDRPPFSFCSGKTTSVGCVPFVSFSGTPSASLGAFDVVSDDHIEGMPAIYVYGVKKADLNFHGGKLCVKAPFKRLTTLIHATDGLACTACAGNCCMFKRDFNQLILSGTDPMLTPGQQVHVQVRQSDPANLGPTGFADNLSDALSFTIGL